MQHTESHLAQTTEMRKSRTSHHLERSEKRKHEPPLPVRSRGRVSLQPLLSQRYTPRRQSLPRLLLQQRASAGQRRTMGCLESPEECKKLAGTWRVHSCHIERSRCPPASPFRRRSPSSSPTQWLLNCPWLGLLASVSRTFYALLHLRYLQQLIVFRSSRRATSLSRCAAAATASASLLLLFSISPSPRAAAACHHASWSPDNLHVPSCICFMLAEWPFASEHCELL